MTNVVVVKNNVTGIVVKSSNPGVISREGNVVLKNTPTIISGGGASTVSSLLDVNTSQVVNGATLVYDSPTQTYIVKPLDVSDLTGSIDGGTF